MTDSKQLLAEYVKNGSETAFRELVARYVDLVHSAAARLVDGNAHLAQDVTQTVFVDLARMARTFSSDVMLGGWLHRHACFVAQKALRSERRRRARERQAVEMNALNDHSQASLAHVAPILDEAIDSLGTADRAVILLRFFEQRDFRGVGEALGTNENAARMRVSRALDKLQIRLKRRGVAFSAAALGTALASDAVAAAPAGLAAGISAAALASATAGGASAITLFKFITMTKLQAGIITTIAIAGAAQLLLQQQAQGRLREENQLLRQQVGQLSQLTSENKRLSESLARTKRAATLRLPAPPIQAKPSGPEPADETKTAEFIARIIKSDKPIQVSAEQIAPYLKANHRSPASLLAAFRATGDAALLREAMEKFPNDPQVEFVALHRKDASPEERRQWLDAFKQSDPNNSVGNYLSAREYFKAGQADEAVKELSAASSKPGMQDFSLDFIQNNEEAFRAAGYSTDEAKVIASISLVLPHLIELKWLNQNMMDLAASYRQAGDTASAQAALEMNMNLGKRLGDLNSVPLITQLVGISIESTALKAMDPASPLGDSGQTVQTRLDELAQRRAEDRELANQFGTIQQSMTPQDWSSYVDRWRIFGEQNAMHWLVAKYGQK